MSPPQNARTSLHTRRALPAHARAAKPPPLVSKKSSTGLPPKKSPTTRTNPSWSKNIGNREVETDTEEDDMTGLPQFCATCEKQIVTPGNSVLYCSESCRKKDHNKPLHESVIPSELSPLPPSRRASAYFGDEDASPMRSPTLVRPPSLAFSDSSETSSLYESRRASYARNESETAHYLSQFDHVASYDYARPSTSTSATPSLSHTPVSVISASGSYRPLPRRGDPFSASFSSYSVDLITPVIDMDSSAMPHNVHYRKASVGSTGSTNTAFHITDEDTRYEKRPFSPDDAMKHGSLRQLFSHDAMQAPPKRPTQLTQAPAHVDEHKESKSANLLSVP
ncbi:hypothetical protein BDV97DRAFT_55472 [Delphinella strobiligena]|nr:hypothetical protein BDV97DRAFT_55472 [Delphinella strobiligena]